MGFSGIKTSWSIVELGLIKISMTCLGMVMGVYFYQYLKPWVSVLFILFALVASWTGLLWVKK